MTTYIYSECSADYWPTIKKLLSPSYNDAVEKLIEKYAQDFDDDMILKFDNFNDLQEYLNENYTFVISDLIDIEEL